jgi:hypothetical protein
MAEYVEVLGVLAALSLVCAWMGVLLVDRLGIIARFEGMRGSTDEQIQVLTAEAAKKWFSRAA